MSVVNMQSYRGEVVADVGFQYTRVAELFLILRLA